MGMMVAHFLTALIMAFALMDTHPCKQENLTHDFLVLAVQCTSVNACLGTDCTLEIPMHLSE